MKKNIIQRSLKNKFVLLACEESQVVTIAFRKLGFNAFSCDIVPCRGKHPEWHLQCDVRDLIGKTEPLWDMLIAFPPCTDLSVSGARYWEQKRLDGRQQKSIDFFMFLANCKIPRKAIENPVGIMSSVWRKPDQIIQPFEYGHPESKKTCLWLENLPKLTPTKTLKLPSCGYWENQTPSGQNKLGPSPERAKIRATTYPGWGEAMADQWGKVL